MLNLTSGMQVPSSRGRLPTFRKTWVHRAQCKVEPLAACAYAEAKKLCREPTHMNPTWFVCLDNTVKLRTFVE